MALCLRGVPLKAVQELLGHATIEMTMRYAHLSPDVRRDVNEHVVGHGLVNDLSSVVLDDDEGEDLTEEGIVGLHEITGPDFVRMVVEERRPVLPAARGAFAGFAHVLLNRPLRDGEAELEEFAADSLGTPESGSPWPSCGSG